MYHPVAVGNIVYFIKRKMYCFVQKMSRLDVTETQIILNESVCLKPNVCLKHTLMIMANTNKGPNQFSMQKASSIIQTCKSVVDSKVWLSLNPCDWFHSTVYCSKASSSPSPAVKRDTSDPGLSSSRDVTETTGDWNFGGSSLTLMTSTLTVALAVRDGDPLSTASTTSE